MTVALTTTGILGRQDVNHHFDVNLIFSMLRTKQFLKKYFESIFA